MSEPVTWGSGTSAVVFNAAQIPTSLTQQQLPILDNERQGRTGVIPLLIDDLTGGFKATDEIVSWLDSRNTYWKNEGLITHIPGVLCLPYANTTDASLISTDASGFRAANKRMHAAMFNGIWVGAVDSHLILSTSVSDETLKIPATSDAVSDKVTAVGVIVANSTRYFAIAGSTTDDIKGTADPTQDTVSWTEIVTLSDTPYINAIQYMPTLGPGVNVVIGRPSTAKGAGHFFFKASDSLPATLTEVVLSETASIEGDLATTTVSEKDFTYVTATPGTAEDVWTTPGNALASDNSYANWTVTMTAALDYSDPLIFHAPDLSAVPLAAKIVAIQVDVEAHEENSADNVFWAIVRLLIKGTAVGINHSDSTELTTSDGTYKSFGDTTSDAWQADLTGDDVQYLSFSMQLVCTGTSGTAVTDVDHARVSVVYRMPGETVQVALGGFSIGPPPTRPERIVCVEPVSDDLTGVTEDRRLVFYDYAWDPAGDRVLLSDVTYPAVGLPYVGVAAHFQGGVAVACGSNSTVWDIVKFVSATGDVVDLDFPATHAGNTLTITQMHAQGAYLMVDTAYTSGAEAQRWVYYDGKWHASFVLQSKGNSIATEPILWAETTVNSRVNYGYRFFPVSTTALAGAEEFVQPDLSKVPWLAHSSEVRQNGPLYVQLNEMDGGPAEANKSILAVTPQTRRIDDDTSYGSVKVDIDTGGDRSISAAEVSKTFNTAADPFSDDNVFSSGDPAVSYDSLIVRLTLDHEASSAETPNGIPILLTLAQQWPHLETMTFMLTPEQPSDLINIRNQLVSLSNTKSVQRLLAGGLDIPATLEDFEISYRATLGVTPPTANDIESALVTFRRVPGSVS